MDGIYLPLLQQTDTIEFALARMTQTDARAIITDYPYRIYTNDVIVDAYIEGKQNCSQLPTESGIAVTTLGPFIEPYNYSPPETPGAYPYTGLEFIFERQFAAEDVNYGVLYVPFPVTPSSVVLVFTRHEEKRYDIETRRKVCVCTGASRHKKYDKNTGDPCDVDPPETYNCY